MQMAMPVVINYQTMVTVLRIPLESIHMVLLNIKLCFNFYISGCHLLSLIISQVVVNLKDWKNVIFLIQISKKKKLTTDGD